MYVWLLNYVHSRCVHVSKYNSDSGLQSVHQRRQARDCLPGVSVDDEEDRGEQN